MTPELRAAAPGLAATALRTVREEFPNGLRVDYAAPGDAPHRPRDRHPAFYGSYDWHSAVEMHWVLARLLRTAPDAVPAEQVRAVFDEHWTAEAVAAEVAFAASSPGWERPYGWAWLLTLHEELASWADTGDADAVRWAAALQPLADHFLGAYARWLPRATYPVRYGLHPNSAFGLLMALPAARRAGVGELLVDAAARWFGEDAGAPVRWEPSGSDFLSPSLVEAVLMAGLVPDVPGWLTAFLPGIAEEWSFRPAVVSDASDGQTAHLHGLNLSRAWCLRRLAAALPATDPRVPGLLSSAGDHAAVALPHVSGSDYMVEHWLAAYALLYVDPAY
jgi:GNAT superfamily N-acetyltransferase